MTRVEPHPIETARLSIVPCSVAHADSLWAAVEESLPELRPWMAWAIDDSYTSNKEFLRISEESWQKDLAWTFTIFYEGRAAGTIGLGVYEPLVGSAQLGYWIRSDLAGRGLTTEAAAAVVRFGFEEVGLHRIELHAALGNAASIRVAEKLGFRRGGVLRDGTRGEAGWQDCYVFDLLESDQRPETPTPTSG